MSNVTGIYKIYNKITDKYYIGQAINIKQRLQQHKYQLNANKHINSKLQEDYNQYGEQSFIFEKIYICEIEFLNAMEKYFIEKYNSINEGYNIQDMISFVRYDIKKEMKLKKLKKEFENLKEVYLDVPKNWYLRYIMHEQIINLMNIYETKYIDDWSYYESCFFDYMNIIDLFEAPNLIEPILKRYLLKKFNSIIKFKDEHDNWDWGIKENIMFCSIEYIDIKDNNTKYKDILIKPKDYNSELIISLSIL